MIYKGYKIRVRCVDWEQIKTIDEYWNLFASYVAKEKIIGLGMNWTKDYLYFDYALGVINDDKTLNKLHSINFSNSNFKPDYIEIDLPEFSAWKVFKGKDENIKQIYEKDIKCYEKAYDYELEYIDKDGNIKIKIHYLNN